MTIHYSGKWCIHYRAMAEHETCEVDVPYEKFKGVTFDKRPCFRNAGEPPRCGCDLMEFPTPEQIASYEAAMKARLQRLVTARQAIAAHLGPWKRGTPGTSGEIECPNCKTGRLKFSRAGYNGHIHARCSTAGCCSWME